MLTQAQYDGRLTYYRRVAADVGVPDLWLDDAAQEMMIRWWRSGWLEGSGIARRAAIDAVRRYGPRTMRGYRHTTEQLHDRLPARDEYGLVATLIDLRKAMRVLTTRQRQALSRSVAGRPMSAAESSHAYAARRKLRAALAA